MFLTIAAAIAVTATVAPANPRPEPRIQASYDRETNRYCLRLTNPDATMPSGIGLYRRICRTQQNWARDGVVVEHRQLASR